MKIQTSEWVSLGHPDKMADFISSFLLDRYLEQDPDTRFALEVQIKDQHVTLGGEITSKAKFSEDDIAAFVRVAVNQIGYNEAYQKKFGEENTICGNDLVVTQHIGQQSPDIAQGVNNLGWGDQGIFWGMAVNDAKTNYMPRDWWLARKIGMMLFDRKVGGLDIKTQVTLIDNVVRDVVVAIPLTLRHSIGDVRNVVSYCLGGEKSYDLHINCTGSFVRHGPIGDCGTTGRKLVVDFYGGNCRIGGGSPWTKDGTKADLSLNLLARNYARETVMMRGLPAVFCSISCRIGDPQITVSLMDSVGIEIKPPFYEMKTPKSVMNMFHLQEPRFADMCRYGLFERCFSPGR